MKIQGLYDIEQDIKINNMKEVKSSIIYKSQNVYNPTGLFSEEIFGSVPKERWYKCGYITLPIHIFNPMIAKTIIARGGGVIRKMAYAECKCDLVNGVLTESPEGKYCGFEDLYKIWDEINIPKTLNTRSKENIDILVKSPKRLIFINKILVLPPNFRPVGTRNGRPVKSEINSIYMKILGYKSITSHITSDAHQVDNKFQNAVIELYTYIQKYLGTKNGFLQKNLLAKTSLWTARNVISAPQYNTNEPEIGIFKTGYPLHTLCTLFNPLLRFQMKQILSYNYLKEIHPNPDEVKGSYVTNMYDDKAISDMLNLFRENYGARFRILYLDPDHTKPILFTGYDNNKKETFTRPMTVTDVIYIAAKRAIVDADRMCYTARYPVLDYMGAFFTHVVILSTVKTVDIQFQGERFKYYPYVDPNMEHSKVASFFKDTLTPSNSNLVKWNGDYDGDTVKSVGLFSDEANQRARELMYSKACCVRLQGTSAYEVSLECNSALYSLTKM